MALEVVTKNPNPIACFGLFQKMVSALWFLLLFWASVHADVAFHKLPLPLTSETSHKFVFEVSEGGNGDSCRNCTITCKLDNQTSTDCEAREVLYTNLVDGEHKFEVCANGSQGAQCTSHIWTVDTSSPTAIVTAPASFTTATNIPVTITFNKPCTGGGGFKCSLDACNLRVQGAGKVLAPTLKVVQPDLEYSVNVELSADVPYQRVSLVMDNNFCTDSAGNRFTRTNNSIFVLHVDRRQVFVDMRTHIPKKEIRIKNEVKVFEATNNPKYLRICLNFSVPVINSTDDIRRALHTTHGTLDPVPRMFGNRRFGFWVRNVTSISLVTVTLQTSSIISRQGTPVSPAHNLTFLYDCERPSVTLSTTVKMTRENNFSVEIMFFKIIFRFDHQAINISGGNLISCNPINMGIYRMDVEAINDTVSIRIPENTAEDIAGNKNVASDLLLVKHYSIPTISTVLSIITTSAYAGTTLLAGLLTVSTASLQSIGALSNPSSYTSNPAANLARITCHIRVLAQTKWLPVTMPVEYYEFSRALEWSVPYLTLPWESKNNDQDMRDSGPLFKVSKEISNRPRLRTSQSLQSKNGILEAENNNTFELADYDSVLEKSREKVQESHHRTRCSSRSCRWRKYGRNMFWLAVICGSLISVHLLILLTLKFRKPIPMTPKHRNYGALVLPRFEITLIIIALPGFCQSAATLIRGGSRAEVVVAILMFTAVIFLLVSLFLFLLLGITMGRFLHYNERQEGQEFNWYQRMVRVAAGPGRRGKWIWKNQSNSSDVAMMGPLIEDVRGPPKDMIAGESSQRTGERITASEATFIQKLWGILRTYYILVELGTEIVLGILAGIFSSNDSPSKGPSAIIFSLALFKLLFLVLNRPFIDRRIQSVESLNIACEVGILGIFLILQEKGFSPEAEKILGYLMLAISMFGFLAQMVNEWLALVNQIRRLSKSGRSFSSGLKMFFAGLLLILTSWEFLENCYDGFFIQEDEQNKEESEETKPDAPDVPDAPDAPDQEGSSRGNRQSSIRGDEQNEETDVPDRERPNRTSQSSGRKKRTRKR